MKYMSNLALAFFQRQNQKLRSRLSSSSTVSSQEVEEYIRQQKVTFKEVQLQEDLVQESSFDSNVNGFIGNETNVNLSSCNEVTVGDRITNVYQSYYVKVMY